MSAVKRKDCTYYQGHVTGGLTQRRQDSRRWLSVSLPRLPLLRPSRARRVLMYGSKSGRDAVGASWCPAVNAPAGPWEAPERFPCGQHLGREAGSSPARLRADTVSPAGSRHNGQVCTGRPAPAAAVCPALPGRLPAAREGLICFCGSIAGSC